ncbi:MAG: LCP family protein [Actinomycetia bacterium]|nr:LCP family protein [Actinomycetes bacterium]
MACIVGLVVSALGLTWGLRRFQDISFLDVPGVEGASDGQPVNWLLVGSDSREGIDPNDPNAAVFIGEEVAGKRTDTIMVARVDRSRQTIDLLSVPRDLWVPIAGTGNNGRVNSAFNGDGGEARLVATVESFLGIEINNYAEVNFVGFQAVIDSLGGVPLWFDTPVRDVKSGLDISTAGCHSLDGFSALAFARSRSLEYFDGGRWRTDPTGDLGRTARQQYLLTRLAQTASARLDPTDLSTIDRVVKAGGQNLIIDDGAGAGELLGLAKTFASVGGGGITRHALPVSGFRTSGGAAVLALDEAGAQPTLDIFRGLVEPPPEVLADDVPQVARNSFMVDVQNGARVAGIARSTSDELAVAGFVIGDIANAETVDQTTILYPSSLSAAAQTLGASLATSPTYEIDEGLTRVVLIIGPDYSGLAGTGTQVAAPTAESAPTTTGAAPVEAAAGQVPAANEVGLVPTGPPPGTVCE